MDPNGEIEVQTNSPCVTQVFKEGLTFYRFAKGSVVHGQEQLGCSEVRKPVRKEGEAYVGTQNWLTLTRTPCVFEPLAQECYVTTAALKGCDVVAGRELLERGVGILDLDQEIRDWMGCEGMIGKYVKEVVVSLRVLPDENRDTVRKLKHVLNVTCRVVESSVPALVIGRGVHHHLLERKARGKT